MAAPASNTKSAGKASGNWMALQKKLKPGTKTALSGSKDARGLRKRPLSSKFPLYKSPLDATTPDQAAGEVSFPRGPEEPVPSTSAIKLDEIRNGESMEILRRMIRGEEDVLEKPKKGANKYIAIDCEMVGVGNNGEESSLARVSVVNYHGVVELDELVQQKERVVDYRTQWSGIRARDMVRARPFEEVQKHVSILIEGKILVGHAVHNDLKALLLSHPRYLIRDTQALAGKHSVVKTRIPALRHLVEHEFGLSIQGGEHSSVVDARATMAIFRLHRKAWESSLPKWYFMAALSHKQPVAIVSELEPDTQAEIEVHGRTLTTGKRKAKSPPAGDEEPVSKARKTRTSPSPTSPAKPSKETTHHVSATLVSGKRMSANQIAASRSDPSASSFKQYPGGGRKGVSSGLSTVVRNLKPSGWWKNLGS